MTRFQAPPTELDGLVLFLDGQREAILNKLDGLTEEQARMRSTVSDLCMLTLVKHVAYVERRWVWCGIGDTEISGIYPDGDREEELSIGPDQTIESIRALYASIVDENRTRLTALTDIGVPLSRGVSPRWILLHLIEELARHAGHADIIRESIDGVVGT